LIFAAEDLPTAITKLLIYRKNELYYPLVMGLDSLRGFGPGNLEGAVPKTFSDGGKFSWDL
jgi:hypothetical protein